VAASTAAANRWLITPLTGALSIPLTATQSRNEVTPTELGPKCVLFKKIGDDVFVYICIYIISFYWPIHTTDVWSYLASPLTLYTCCSFAPFVSFSSLDHIAAEGSTITLRMKHDYRLNEARQVHLRSTTTI
jgi:hypothetical protein